MLKICVGINKEKEFYDYTCPPSANKPWTMKAVNAQLQLNHRTIHPMLRPHPHTNPDFLPRGLQGYHIIVNCNLPIDALSKICDTNLSSSSAVKSGCT